jgi:hypothetical protein
MSCIYASLGCAAKCGHCAHTFKIMLEQIKRFATGHSLAIDTGKVH